MVNRSNLYIGIMSGTSVDAVDVVIAEITHLDHGFKILGSMETAFPDQLREAVIKLCDEQFTTLIQLGELTTKLTDVYASAVNHILSTHKIKPTQINVIGCHGQTVCHAPQSTSPFSMQLVNAAQLAAATTIPVVTGFRDMDIALGGEGAPLVPLFHQYLLNTIQNNHAYKPLENERVLETPTATATMQADWLQQGFLNIGGMANISLFNAEQTIGFDTGPGNILLDAWVQSRFGLKFDRGGEIAQHANIIPELLNLLLETPYFQLPAPKSTGREVFNLKWLENHIGSNNYCPKDVLSTLVELTAVTIGNAIKGGTVSIEEPSTLWLFGGGSHNGYLINRLKLQLPNWQLKPTNELALCVSEDELEAAAFAWLAYRRCHKLSGNLPNVTGARVASISGSLTLPPSFTSQQ